MTSSVAPRRRTLPAVLFAALLAAAAVLLPALPAAAHDELVSTDPSADATLDALPPELTLTFSADVLTDPGATVMEVTDATGASLAAGDPEVSGAEVTQTLAGTASGVVTVAWRVVSSDGHPIDGTFSFSVAAASPTPSASPSVSASATTSPTPTVSEAASPAASSAPTAAPADEASSPSPLPWILLAIALVVVVGVLVYVFASRGPRGTAGGRPAGR